MLLWPEGEVGVRFRTLTVERVGATPDERRTGESRIPADLSGSAESLGQVPCLRRAADLALDKPQQGRAFCVAVQADRARVVEGRRGCINAEVG